MFQSLSGFQVRCNPIRTYRERGFTFVSIPIGFSGSLQQYYIAERALSKFFVSIPIGFSGSLQLEYCLISFFLYPSFNPYRVFRFAATASLQALF